MLVQRDLGFSKRSERVEILTLLFQISAVEPAENPREILCTRAARTIMLVSTP